MLALAVEKLKNDAVISLLTSFIMLRRDSSSLIPRENVRFLGEPLLSRVTESIFDVLYEVLVYVRDTPDASEVSGVAVLFVSYAAVSEPPTPRP